MPIETVKMRPIETVKMRPIETVKMKPIETVKMKPIETVKMRPIETVKMMLAGAKQKKDSTQDQDQDQDQDERGAKQKKKDSTQGIMGHHITSEKENLAPRSEKKEKENLAPRSEKKRLTTVSEGRGTGKKSAGLQRRDGIGAKKAVEPVRVEPKKFDRKAFQARKTDRDRYYNSSAKLPRPNDESIHVKKTNMKKASFGVQEGGVKTRKPIGKEVSVKVEEDATLVEYLDEEGDGLEIDNNALTLTLTLTLMD